MTQRVAESTRLPRIRVLYILASTHSGTTLLHLLLGAHSRIESIGELERVLGERGKTRTHSCTCGKTLAECDFWERARARAAAMPLVGEGYSEFERTNYPLMAAILERTGRSVICDSSKGLERLQQLLASPLFDVSVVHCVRDGRAVAFSMRRKLERMSALDPDGDGGRALRARGKEPRHYGFYRTALAWNVANSRVARRAAPYLVRYEDLCARPAEVLGGILAHLDLTFEESQLRFLDGDHHHIGGNRMRRGGDQTIRIDVEYRKSLSPLEWWAGTLLALAALRRFGYGLGRGTTA